LAVVGTARFIFFKTAELETQRKSLEQLTGSIEDTNKIIKELQDFGAVTPFTSSELIEQTKRLKAFGFETEELVDTTKRLSDVAGATGADLTGIATAFGQIRAKGKLQQEENLQLLERGVNITDELKKITKLQGDEFESAMRKGEIGADLVNQALINLTSQGAIFAGGATAQADTLNGKLSTLQDTIDTLARTIGEDLSEEIKGVIDIAIAGVKEINKLIERIGVANKVGRINLANIAMEARGEARQQVRQEKGFFAPLTGEGREREKELFEEIKARKIEEALTTKELTKQKDTQDKIKESVTASKNEAAIINEKTELLNESLGQTNTAVNTINNGSKEITENVKKVKSETDQLKNEFAEIGETIGSQITDALVGAINGTKSLGESARNVLNDLANSILKSGINSLLGGVFGGTKIGGFLGFANGGNPPVGRASIVGEKGPELFVPRSAGTIIPNNAIGGGGVTNMVTINVDATGSAVEGNEEEANEFGSLLAVAIQGELVKQQRPGGILSNTR